MLLVESKRLLTIFLGFKGSLSLSNAAGLPDKHVCGWRSQSNEINSPKRSSRASRRAGGLAALNQLRRNVAAECSCRAPDTTSIIERLSWPQRLLEQEADRIAALGFSVAEVYLRSASLSVGHAAIYLGRALDAEGRGAAPPDPPFGLLDWL